MTLPDKIKKVIIDEANKDARFGWYQGWEKSSGYIKTELRGCLSYGACRIYIKWEKKKEPTEDQIKGEIENHIENLLQNKCHHSEQRDFRHYLLCTFFVDVNRLKHEAINSVIDCLPDLLKIIEASELFTEPHILNLHNDLKNLEAGVNDHESIERFLDLGKLRIGEK